jgi:hypothetical protein
VERVVIERPGLLEIGTAQRPDLHGARH